MTESFRAGSMSEWEWGLSQTDHLPQFPLYLCSLSLHPFQGRLCRISHVQSLSCISFARRNSTPAASLRREPSCTAPRVTRCTPHTVFTVKEGAGVTGAPPRFRPIVCHRVAMLSAAALSPRVQRGNGRTGIDVLGASLIHDAVWGVYVMGSKGQEGFSSVESAYTSKTLMCSSFYVALQERQGSELSWFNWNMFKM